MEELARYQENYAALVVSRDGDQLVFWSDFDDNGRSLVSETRIALADFLAKGQGPWPWYDLGDRRAGALQIVNALGLTPPAWTEPLPSPVLALFDAARNGWASVADRVAGGVEPDVLDPCGATPLWYAVRSLNTAAALVLLDSGADPGRRVELSARGDRFTTVLHEMVLCGRTEALARAIAGGVDPAPRDSDGATPIHRLDEHTEHLNPGMVRALVEAGADVNASTFGGQTPVEAAAQRLLRETVTVLLDQGARPGRALTTLLVWWAVNRRWYTYRAREVVSVVETLRMGGATVTERDRELASEAGDLEVIAALDR